MRVVREECPGCGADKGYGRECKCQGSKEPKPSKLRIREKK